MRTHGTAGQTAAAPDAGARAAAAFPFMDLMMNNYFDI